MSSKEIKKGKEIRSQKEGVAPQDQRVIADVVGLGMHFPDTLEIDMSSLTAGKLEELRRNFMRGGYVSLTNLVIKNRLEQVGTQSLTDAFASFVIHLIKATPSLTSLRLEKLIYDAEEPERGLLIAAIAAHPHLQNLRIDTTPNSNGLEPLLAGPSLSSIRLDLNCISTAQSGLIVDVALRSSSLRKLTFLDLAELGETEEEAEDTSESKKALESKQSINVTLKELTLVNPCFWSGAKGQKLLSRFQGFKALNRFAIVDMEECNPPAMDSYMSIVRESGVKDLEIQFKTKKPTEAREMVTRLCKMLSMPSCRVVTFSFTCPALTSEMRAELLQAYRKTNRMTSFILRQSKKGSSAFDLETLREIEKIAQFRNEESHKVSGQGGGLLGLFSAAVSNLTGGRPTSNKPGDAKKPPAVASSSSSSDGRLFSSSASGSDKAADANEKDIAVEKDEAAESGDEHDSGASTQQWKGYSPSSED